MLKTIPFQAKQHKKHKPRPETIVLAGPPQGQEFVFTRPSLYLNQILICRGAVGL